MSPAEAKAKSAAARAKSDRLLNSQTPAQLEALWKHARNVHTPEAAVVRGAIHSRLCVLVGDERADEICEAA